MSAFIPENFTESRIKAVDIPLGVQNGETDSDGTGFHGFEFAMRRRRAVQTAARADAATIERVGDLGGGNISVGEGNHAALGSCERTNAGKRRKPLIKFFGTDGKTVVYFLHSEVFKIADTAAESYDGRGRERPRFIAVGEIFRHFCACRVTAAAAFDKTFTQSFVAENGKAAALNPEKPFVPGCTENIARRFFKVDFFVSDCLRCIENLSDFRVPSADFGEDGTGDPLAADVAAQRGDDHRGVVAQNGFDVFREISVG